ncbi:MAG: rod-binding protein [Syntrophomonas sp.]
MNINALSSAASVDPSQYLQKTESDKTDNFAKALEDATKQKDKERLKESCQQLESVFLNQIMQAMRATISKSDLLGNDFSDDVFQSMLDEEYTKSMSKTGSLGLADIIYKQLSENLMK